MSDLIRVAAAALAAILITATSFAALATPPTAQAAATVMPILA